METHIAQKKLEPTDRYLKLPQYAFAKIAELKKSLNPEDLIDLSLGSPDIPTPPAVIDALLSSVRDSNNHGYPPFDGKLSLRAAIAEWFFKRFGVQIAQKHSLPLLGSKEGWAHLPLLYLNPGDTSIIPDPHYPVHHRGSILAGAEIHDLILRPENGYLPDLDSIPVSVAQKAKIIVANYPNNPTGAMANDSFMKELVAFCRKYNILLCHDLAYSEMSFGEDKPKSIFEYMSPEENALEFFTFSKTYHMAGFRIGFCVGNPQIISDLYHLKTNLDYGVPGAIQDGAIAALSLPDSHYSSLREVYKSRAELLYRELTEKLGWSVFRPGGAMYLWVKAPAKYQGHGEAFALDLLQKAGIAVTPGIAFGKQGHSYVRFALVQPEEKLLQVAQRAKDL